MSIAVFGAGAIGAYVGARLFEAGAPVTLIARGAHLRAMAERGLILRERGGPERRVDVPVSDEPERLGAKDYVLLALKAQQVLAACPAIAPLLGEGSALVTLQNGLPWWYFYGLAGEWRERRLASLDPGDVQWRTLGPERVIGAVVYPAAEIVEPGIVEVVSGHELNRLPLGEPDGSLSKRAKRLSALLIEAGFKAPVKRDIRTEIWVKLWGNLAFNPIGALTGATLEAMARDPHTHALIAATMREAQEVAARLKITMPVSIEQRIAGAERVGAHKPSMLQDLERRRSLELEALLGCVAELGRMVGVATPLIDALYALVSQRARIVGCHTG